MFHRLDPEYTREGDRGRVALPSEQLGAVELTEHQLAKQSHQEMSGVLAAPRLRQNLSAQFAYGRWILSGQRTLGLVNGAGQGFVKLNGFTTKSG